MKTNQVTESQQWAVNKFNPFSFSSLLWIEVVAERVCVSLKRKTASKAVKVSVRVKGGLRWWADA